MARKSVYPELVGRLERKICEMPRDAMLPSEQALANELGVSKPTLRRSLQTMLDAGQIHKVNGVGVFVGSCGKAISRELVFLCHDIVFFAETLKSFGEAAAKANYFISIVPISGDAQAQDRLIASVINRKPAGVIVYGDPVNSNLPSLKLLAEIKLPTVHLIRLPNGLDGNLVTFGNSDGLTEIVETFYNAGCRKIALYADEFVNPAAAKEREQGFLDGMKRCRLKPQDELLCQQGESKEKQEKFLEILASENAPDAVCCVNDNCAGNLMKKLVRKGANLSKMKFSGFDHAPLVEFLPCEMLTVEPPMRELGLVATELLLRQIENPGFAFQRKKLKARVLTTKGEL